MSVCIPFVLIALPGVMTAICAAVFDVGEPTGLWVGIIVALVAPYALACGVFAAWWQESR